MRILKSVPSPLDSHTCSYAPLYMSEDDQVICDDGMIANAIQLISSMGHGGGLPSRPPYTHASSHKPLLTPSRPPYTSTPYKQGSSPSLMRISHLIVGVARTFYHRTSCWRTQGTITFGIHYAVGIALNLLGFTNSNWVGDSIDRKSTSGYSLSLGSGPICWSSKKQAVVALSSAEAEYRGVVNITIQALWLQHFLTELGVQLQHPIVISCDNQSTLKFHRDPIQ
eukprot:PITA_06113